MNEWISVKDRLPDKDGEYLVCTKSFLGRFTRIIYYTLNYDSPFKEENLQGRAIWYGYDGEAGDYEVDNVTHWMPMPKLPND